MDPDECNFVSYSQKEKENDGNDPCENNLISNLTTTTSIEVSNKLYQ